MGLRAAADASADFYPVMMIVARLLTINVSCSLYIILKLFFKFYFMVVFVCKRNNIVVFNSSELCYNFK